MEGIQKQCYLRWLSIEGNVGQSLGTIQPRTLRERVGGEGAGLKAIGRKRAPIRGRRVGPHLPPELGVQRGGGLNVNLPIAHNKSVRRQGNERLCGPSYVRNVTFNMLCAELKGVPEFGRRRVQKPLEEATYFVQSVINCVGGYDSGGLRVVSEDSLDTVSK